MTEDELQSFAEKGEQLRQAILRGDASASAQAEQGMQQLLLNGSRQLEDQARMIGNMNDTLHDYAENWNEKADAVLPNLWTPFHFRVNYY